MRWSTKLRVVLPWLLVFPFAAWTVLRLAGWDDWYPFAQLIAFTPYVAAGALLALIVVVVTRRWAATALAGLTVLALAACVLPRWAADTDPLAGAKGPALRVVSANVLGGGARATELVRIVREQHADVLAMQEFTPEFMAQLDAQGLAELLPHRVVYPVDGVGGSAVYARYPLRDDGLRVNPGGFGQAKAELTLPDQRRVLIESAHPYAPSQAGQITDRWRRSYPDQPRATPDGPVRILLGDFNATLDHSMLRDLIDSGYRDAASVLGQGLTGTWGPYDGDLIPPVVLDRVLADRRVGIREFRVLDLAGSDHRTVLAELVLP